MPNHTKILIDTDIGDDIDDAIALYAAMRQDFEIVGVTTVFLNTLQRARMVKKLMCEYGRGYEQVPIFAGHGTPLCAAAQEYPTIPHYTQELEDERYTPNGTTPDEAVDFIIDACHRYQKELTVVAIGPFTNLARVIQKDPEALNLVSRVVIMGGAYFRQYADWNVLCDAHAAQVMFGGIDRLECLGADVTHQAIGEEALYQNLLDYQGSEPAHRYLWELCRLWRVDRPRARLVLHDPLVIYYLNDPLLCEMQEAHVAVLTSGYARGMTLNVEAYAKRKYNTAYADFCDDRVARVAKSVELSRLHGRIFSDFDV